MSTGKQQTLDELYLSVGMPIDTYIGTDSTSNVCMIAGMTLPKTRLNEIKSMAQTNANTIKKNMETAKSELFDDSMDFLNIFEEDKPVKEEKKVSSWDVLKEFL